MSLYLLIPPDDAPESLWDVWFAHHPEDSALAAQDRASLVDKLALGVEHYVDLLLDADAVVIAAAGNDALTYASAGHPDHLQPRMPADYDKVICVVAANREGKIAEYSNRADVPMKGNCIATWGGEGVVSAAPDYRGTVVVPADRDGVVGLFTRPRTAMNEENKSGWVYWSGTSFATPIISGLAAVLLGNDLSLTQRTVMGRLYDMAQPSAQTDPALGCPYIGVSQRQ
jgi:subtilisin family serine protease